MPDRHVVFPDPICRLRKCSYSHSFLVNEISDGSRTNTWILDCFEMEIQIHWWEAMLPGSFLKKQNSDYDLVTRDFNKFVLVVIDLPIVEATGMRSHLGLALLQAPFIHTFISLPSRRYA